MRPTIEPLGDGETFKAAIHMLGSYEFELSVVDEHGLASCATSRVTVESTPVGDFLVELTWETPSDPDESDTEGTDLDLHMLPPGEVYWASAISKDCYYGQTRPSWGQPMYVEDDPIYHFEDTDGAGPEYITLRQPVLTGDEGYLIGVHNKDAGKVPVPSFATVRLIYHGEVFATIAEKGGTKLEEDQFWLAGELFWTADGPSLVTSEVPVITEGFPNP